MIGAIVGNIFDPLSTGNILLYLLVQCDAPTPIFPWTVLTAIFLHASILHITSNVLLPSLLRLHSRRTSVEIALGDDFLRYWTGRQFGIRRLRRPRLPPVRRNTNNRLCGRCVWRSLRHSGHSSGSNSSAPANLPSGYRYPCRRWASTPPWRTSRWARPEKILVTWGRNFPGNLAMDSIERS